MENLPMMIIISGYTLSRKSSMENPDRREGVPTSLWENPRRSSLEESMFNLSVLNVI